MLNSVMQVLRQQYYKTRFRFVEPIQITLVQNKYHKPCVFHYVPVKETLQALLKDVTVFQ